MRQTCLSAIVLCLLAALPVAADIIDYTVDVNTSAIAGTTGYLDFQFNPGPLGSQFAWVDIYNLTGATPLPCLLFSCNFFVTGDVVGGPAPALVAIANDTQFNDDFQEFTFGSAIQFNLIMTGPALESPDGISASGSSFGFGIFDSTGTQPLLTTDPDGFALEVDVNLDGSTTSLTFPSDANGGPSVVSYAPTPEPSTLILLFTALMVLAAASRRQLSR